jgi:DNA-binding response OmpR family regulator
VDIPEGRVEDLVRRVRKRLGKQYIKTHWGQGYEFLG